MSFTLILSSFWNGRQPIALYGYASFDEAEAAAKIAVTPRQPGSTGGWPEAYYDRYTILPGPAADDPTAPEATGP